MENSLQIKPTNEWVLARSKPKISEIPPVERVKQMVDLFSEALILYGTTNNEVAFVKIATAVLEYMKANPKFSNITMDELKIFVRKGLANDYGTFKNQLCTINFTNLTFWLKKGIEDQSRIEALRKAEEEKFVAKKPSDEQIRAELIASCHNTYNDMKNGKVYLNLKPPFALYYDYLLERYGIEVERNGKVGKTLITNSADKVRVDKEAIEDFNSYIQAGFKKQSDITDFNTYADRMLHSQSRVNCIKKHHVIYLFKQLIEQGEDL